MSYLTPAKLHGTKRLPIQCEFAIINYCPVPTIFDEYDLKLNCDIRYFIHSHPMHVKFCCYKGYNFVTISEVYGGPMSVTTVEELNFYGIRIIYGIGYVGLLPSFSHTYAIGDNLYAKQAFTAANTTHHYDHPNPSASLPEFAGLVSHTIWTTDEFYQETPDKVSHAEAHGCTVVNMDTAHFYAACQKLSLLGVYCATISDVLGQECKLDAMHCLTVSQNNLVLSILEAETKSYMRCVEEFREFLSNKAICTSHAIDHALKVMEHAIHAIAYTNLDIRTQEAIILAALLHDADDGKFFTGTGYPNASYILRYKSQHTVDLILEMIDLVSCSKNKDTIVPETWKLIPRYADRLESIGNIGIQRCYTYTKTIKNPLIIANTLRPHSLSELEACIVKSRYEMYNGKSASMIDHYYDKLLHLKCAIDNEYLCRETNARIEIMKQFVIHFCSSRDEEEQNQVIQRYCVLE